MENYLELIANDNESNANAILNKINLTEFLGDANDVSINSNGEIVEGRTAAVATTSKPWTIQKVENAEITSRSACKPNWDRDKNCNV